MAHLDVEEEPERLGEQEIVQNDPYWYRPLIVHGSPLRLVYRSRNAVRGTRSGFHAPIHVVTVSSCEVHASYRLYACWPEFLQLPRSIIGRLTCHSPSILQPIDRHDVIDISGFTGIILPEYVVGCPSGNTGLCSSDHQTALGWYLLSHWP